MLGKTGIVAESNAIDIAVIGATGRIGRRVLELIAARQALMPLDNPRLRVVAVANSRACLAVRAGLPAADVAERLSVAAPAHGIAQIAALERVWQPHIVLDCTASAEIAARYPRWLAAGIDVVTPNKFGPSADRPLAHAIAAAQAVSGAVLRDSTSVGAQLPLLYTLRGLRDAGDLIERFEAVLSGTLSYVLGSVQQGAALSAAVRDAVAQGYAEPHPARDLSGEDAARKLVILLRALGHDVEFVDVERVPLVDAELLDESDPARLLSRLAEADEGWRARAAVAEARRECWVYRASFDNGHARVAPERVPRTHALANLAPCENSLILHSAYYRTAPLRISGPGAGIDLTAAGVFADLLVAAQHHGVRRGVVESNADERVEAAA
jgi:aspartokinase/homoserine dehydrogenase 1